MIRIAFLLLFITYTHSLTSQGVFDPYGALIRSDTQDRTINLCFTGHDHYEGFEHVLQVLNDQKIKASFFLTGDFVRSHRALVKQITAEGHLIGAHSDKHLLYCDWTDRDSLLYRPSTIKSDIMNNLQELSAMGIRPTHFMPPYEWYNRNVVDIARELNQITVNFSPGTRSNADYTTPDMPNYAASDKILESMYTYEKLHGMNGFHLLIHPGTSPLRKDKLYLHLDTIINTLKNKGYQFSRF
jgi:peptidoglycan/xylan/chitin deacetylase (PgdA/CDA1 family)